MSKRKRNVVSADWAEGFTQIPNRLLEALTLVKLSRVQLSICLLVLRRTYGWNQYYDAVSLSDFAAVCGCSKYYVSYQVAALIRMNILCRVFYESGKTSIYSINFNISDWGRECIDPEELERNIDEGVFARGYTEVQRLPSGEGVEICQKYNGRVNYELTLGLQESVTVDHDSSLEPPGFEQGLNKELNKKKERESYCPDSIPYQLSNLLLMKILEHLPGYKIPDLQKWSEQMDVMMRNDHRKPEEVKSLILYAQNDHFWRSNILSVEKLRKQYDQLNSKRMRVLSSSSGGKYQPADSFAEEADEYKDFYS